MTATHFYPVGRPGEIWGTVERGQWRAQQVRQRSYADGVLNAVDRLRDRFDVQTYGTVSYAEERFPLLEIRSRHWQSDLPGVLVTGAYMVTRRVGCTARCGLCKSMRTATRAR